ncbi:sodium:proton antiporter [Methylococcaceae bacterium HT1]|uniref:sodium:proton antiporter NhaD n=1 Tax=Bathymodiolus platifrons methanotrophic gill symbiont TaxID=113268 RepID=UPI000B411754|nr:sodium:proton antiporter NhaD [Bathymodiolus platifrons methanotrophic gill symbiont]MCK5869642.1 sodium:proton antiporter NhaD [Methyloprofundus sp.]TXK97862.1 sodium:proton antiporter [Methylococcaceae bacterium CS4]TXL00430.1 sodium:proton antiporter [Methylococcaceae bacterium CS5]TXL02136.1 sodium:proton antiporter [Methylococcaceae bacterium HT1]TXL07538.1 sodium:proton antiporter [Methylococcaceae bacterium CS3]TXL08110.1 sodium:proton antiporter [Methylococcaceae bacterium CS1]TXL
MPQLAMAEEQIVNLGLTGTERGIYTVLIFIIAYGFVMAEEFTGLRKSKPVIIAAAVIWAHAAILAAEAGVSTEALHEAFEFNLKEYAALMLFLLVAMTYINAMAERNVFEALRSWMIRKEFGYKKLFWITGIITFFLSAVADNLTSALLVGAVVLAVGKDNEKFVAIGFVNLVVAANAGGAFSPFGDITTLMVWQAGYAEFFDFFALFIPSVVNYLIPAYFMWLAVPDEQPAATNEAAVELKPGAIQVCVLFILTIVTAVSFKQVLHLPPFMGMMAGLGVLMVYGFRLKTLYSSGEGEEHDEFDIFDKVRDAEWDTLFFFFGVVFAVGGLGYIGYLELIAAGMYDGLGQTPANIIVGVISAIVDNIPVMFAVLSMNLDMDLYQWLLVTLTAGTGGSMLSVGSAAGVALMGSSNHKYTFFSHMKWTPVIALGYIASIFVHYLING